MMAAAKKTATKGKPKAKNGGLINATGGAIKGTRYGK